MRAGEQSSRPVTPLRPHRPRWAWLLIGGVVATVWTGLSSPFFVRSYLPNETRLGISVPAPGSIYRWRSEGYANTHVGPLGMPGRSSLPAAETPSLVLWGDSQAEGLPVSDPQKLFAQIERRTARPVLPLGRSGDGLGDWVAQWPLLELQVDVDAHCILIVDFPDLLDMQPPASPTDGRLRGLTAKLPAFVVHSIRNLLTEADGSPRSLRFRPGPVKRSLVVPPPSPIDASEVRDGRSVGTSQLAAIDRSVHCIAEATARPVRFIYCPPRPIVVHGKWVRKDPHADAANAFAKALAVHPQASRFTWIDMTDAFAESVRRDEIPLGFHNGQIGVGHLNPIGYQLIAEAVAKAERGF